MLELINLEEFIESHSLEKTRTFFCEGNKNFKEQESLLLYKNLLLVPNDQRGFVLGQEYETFGSGLMEVSSLENALVNARKVQRNFPESPQAIVEVFVPRLFLAYRFSGVKINDKYAVDYSKFYDGLFLVPRLKLGDNLLSEEEIRKRFGPVSELKLRISGDFPEKLIPEVKNVYIG